MSSMAKRNLIFDKPLMNAAGTLGFAPEVHAPVDWTELGAFITNPLSLRPRATAEKPAMLEYEGGFLLHTGLPNPGFSSALTRYARRWADAAIPIIVHLMADRPEETREMARALENVENIVAIELGFAPLLADDIILLVLQMLRGELPLIACLPPDQTLRLGPRALDQGAAAISLAAPRGTLSRGGLPITGRIFGPTLFPQALELVYSAAKLGLPCIGAGGVFSRDDAAAMLAAGAIAVQMDAAFWIPAE